MQMFVMDFEYEVSEEQFTKDNSPEMARHVSQVPGLMWKYWLHSSEGKECLGVYHFADRESAETYMTSDWVKQFGAMPGYTIRSMKLYELIKENSKICRAPGVE